jgi:photosystem II stability/assembly factor-like uncharacterized protein
MRKISFFLLFVLLLSTFAYSQGGWYVQKTSFPSTPKAMNFFNEYYGWVLLDSAKIVRTTNGGLSWSQVYSMQSPYPAFDIKFLNPMTGWAAGGDPYGTPLYTEYCMILKTTNGGINWVLQYSDDWGPHFNTVAIADSMNVFAAASGVGSGGFVSTGRLLKTGNGGLNWVSDATIGNCATNSVMFINQFTGWASSYGRADVPPTFRWLLKTTNKGSIWNIVAADTINILGAERSKLFFTDALTGYCKDRGFLYRTSNGGFNWSRLDSASMYFTDVFFANKDTGWITNNNTIFRTNNSGNNWINQSAPAGATKVFFINAKTGWALGSSLMKTTSGGEPERDFANYFPLQIGNKYLYHWQTLYSSGDFWAAITMDTIVNGHRYYYMMNFPGYLNEFVRYDSATSGTMVLSQNQNCNGYVNEYLWDSLRAQVGNTFNSCTYNGPYVHCTQYSIRNLFNNFPVMSKTFYHDGLTEQYVTYGENFGIIGYSAGEPPPPDYFVSLKGCVLNGVVYGDTIMSNVQKEGSETPYGYLLEQNYPNPFNPVTNIKFEIPKTSLVKISVYDIMGREIDVLVNEQMQAGIYKVSWNGYQHSSGVYFCRMTSGGFTDTKRMVLVK